jgi:hypothetical protein
MIASVSSPTETKADQGWHHHPFCDVRVPRLIDDTPFPSFRLIIVHRGSLESLHFADSCVQQEFRGQHYSTPRHATISSSMRACAMMVAHLAELADEVAEILDVVGVCGASDGCEDLGVL